MDTKTGRGTTTLLVLPGDGIGPEIVAATMEVLDAADRRFKLGLAYETADIGFASLRACGTTTPDAVVERAKQAAGVDPRAGVAQRLSAGAPRAVSIRPANCAAGSICSPTSGRRGRDRACRRAAAATSIS